MRDDELAGVIAFLKNAEKLKSVTRSAHTATGRQESTAEHTWRLCLSALLFTDGLEGVDRLKLLEVCLVHDLGEAISGDVPAIHQRPGVDKSVQERADLLTLLEPLDAERRDKIVALWDEYEAAETPEARLAKGLDKLETILQHVQGDNPPGFDHGFNLGYGRKHTDRHPLLARVRALLDEQTRALAGGGTKG